MKGFLLACGNQLKNYMMVIGKSIKKDNEFISWRSFFYRVVTVRNDMTANKQDTAYNFLYKPVLFSTNTQLW